MPVSGSTTLDKPDMHNVARTSSSQNVGHDVPEITAAQNRHLLLKTDMVIMPMAILCMTLAFLDKVRKSLRTQAMTNMVFSKYMC